MVADRTPSLAFLVDRLQLLIRTHLWAQIVAAMVLGVATGLTLSPSGLALLSEPLASTVGAWLALPGHVFLAMIQMIVIPLVMSSVMLGIASSGSMAQLRRLGLFIAPYFAATTLIAVSIGISLVHWIEPGAYIDASLVEKAMGNPQAIAASAVPVDEPVSLFSNT